MTKKSKKITEIEIKAYVTDIELIRRNLLNLGAKDIGNFEYDDVYFVPLDESEKREFLKNEEEYRIRKIKNNGKFLKLVKTYKKPVSEFNKKTKREWETTDHNPTDFAILKEEIFEREYVQYVNVKKAGSNFSIEYKYLNETFHLDLTLSKVEHCGCFLEIECPLSDEAASFERQKAYDVIYAFLFEVGSLKISSIELKYYTELVSEYIQRVKSDDYSYLCDSLSLESLIAAWGHYSSLKSKKYLYNYLLETGYLKVKVLKDTHSKKLVPKCYLYENWRDTLKHTRAIKFIKYIKEEFQNDY